MSDLVRETTRIEAAITRRASFPKSGLNMSLNGRRQPTVRV
jgi:hypothetical protein